MTKMNHWSVRLLVAALAVGLTQCGGDSESASSTERRPNVLVILADDQGWGDLSVHGNTNLSTPHIDSLARDGAMFELFYVNPVCSPTRAEFLTGRYAARGGVRGVSVGEERLNLDEHTIAETFQSAGYATGAFGKWHNGTQAPYHPNSRGFDEFYGFTEGHWGHYFSPELDHNGTLVRGEGYLTDDFTNHALAFIEDNRDQPFFAYLPYNTPHSPMQVPDPYWERFKDKTIEMRHRDPDREDVPFTRAALAMVENIDWNVGRVLTKLDDLGLRENTIVVYFSDNGPNSWRWNAGMKGRKGSLDEGGVRSPFLIRWPGEIPSGVRIPQIAGAIDLLPTLADLAGIPAGNEKPLDGTSLKPLLTGDTSDGENQGAAEGVDSPWPDRMIFTIWRGQISARNQTYRLDAEGRLFDLMSDPGQDQDVAAENPEIATQLQQASRQLADQIAADWGQQAAQALSQARQTGGSNATDPDLTLPDPPDERPFPVGYAPTTLLPARDGIPHGGIERSSRHPNCSFFTNWTSKGDKMTWDIEVAQAGTYEARVHYTVPPADVGATVELTFTPKQTNAEPLTATDQANNRSTVSATIDQPHDPPLYGPADDRVPRSESPVKDFKAMSLGIIELGQGRGELALQATGIPGNQVADVRYVVLAKR